MNFPESESKLFSNEIKDLFATKNIRHNESYNRDSIIETLTEKWKDKTKMGINMNCFWTGVPYPVIFNMPLFLILKELSVNNVNLYFMYHEDISILFESKDPKQFNPRIEFEIILRNLGIKIRKRKIEREILNEIVQEEKFREKYGNEKESLLEANKEIAANEYLPWYPQFQTEYFVATDYFKDENKIDFIIAGEDRFSLYERCKEIAGTETDPLVLYIKDVFNYKKDSGKPLTPLTLARNIGGKEIENYCIGMKPNNTEFLLDWEKIWPPFYKKFLSKKLGKDYEKVGSLIPDVFQQIKEMINIITNPRSESKLLLEPLKDIIPKSSDEIFSVTEAFSDIKSMAVLGVLMKEKMNMTLSDFEDYFSETKQKKTKSSRHYNPDLKMERSTIKKYLHQWKKLDLISSTTSDDGKGTEIFWPIYESINVNLKHDSLEDLNLDYSSKSD